MAKLDEGDDGSNIVPPKSRPKDLQKVSVPVAAFSRPDLVAPVTHENRGSLSPSAGFG
jgi:hypothetical protein